MRRRVLAAGTAGVSAATPAIAAGKRGGSSMPAIKGPCERLAIAGKDATEGCSGKLLNTSYCDGRTGFYFVASGAVVVTFSGMGSNQIKSDADKAVQPIDKVIVTRAGQTSGTPAVSTCTFDNP